MKGENQKAISKIEIKEGKGDEEVISKLQN